ncbi:MAG: hypothetical protein JXQ93_02620 [Flavobacteriaceae bacterium]
MKPKKDPLNELKSEDEAFDELSKYTNYKGFSALSEEDQVTYLFPYRQPSAADISSAYQKNTALIISNIGSLMQELASLIQIPLLFQVTETERKIMKSWRFIEQFLRGLEETKKAKNKLLKVIEAGRKANKATISIKLKDYLPDFVKGEIKKYLGQKVLDHFLGLKPFVIDLKTCKAKSSKNKKTTLKGVKLGIDGLPGFLKFIIEKIFGKTLDIEFETDIEFKIDCKKLKTCTLELTDVSGIIFVGAIPDPDRLMIDTKKGTFLYKHPIFIPDIEFDLKKLLKEFKELIDDLKKQRDKEKDKKKKKKIQDSIDLLEKELKKFNEQKDKLAK